MTLIPGAAFPERWMAGCAPIPPKDGKVLWEYDTARDFTTVNGVKANGRVDEQLWMTIVSGMLYVNSGYRIRAGFPGNVLLAFSGV